MTKRRWSDDPWSALTMDEAEAWRAGWRAACVKVGDVLRDAASDPDTQFPGFVSMAADMLAAMEPPPGADARAAGEGEIDRG